MRRALATDRIVNIALLATGLGSASAAFGYGLGTLSNFGAGTFPFFLGLGLVGFALLDLVKGGDRQAEGDGEDDLPLRRILCLCGSLAAFAMLLPLFGFVPSIFAASLIAVMAEPQPNPLSALLYVAALTLVCYLVFIIGLGLPIPAFR